MNAAARSRRALAVWLVGFGALRLTLWAPEVCPPFSADQARAAAISAGNWIVANQDESGRFLYAWDRNNGEESNEYNLVRHAGVTMSLYQLIAAGQVEYFEAADTSLQWMLDRLVPTAGPAGDGVAFTDVNEAKLGASALLAVSLAQRRLVTGETDHDATMLALGRFMVGQQRDDGGLINLYDVREQAPVGTDTSVYSTGEALWAIALLHEAFGDQGFDTAAWLTLDYITTDRDTELDLWPQPWPDQWAAYSLAEMVEWGLEPHHIEYARAMTERYGYLVRFDSQRGTVYGNLTHGPAPRGSGMGTWVEGLAELRDVVVHEPDLADLAGPTTQVLACGAARLADHQVGGGPDVDPRAAGAWFYDDVTRMDDQQHAASGLLGAEVALP